MRCSRAGLPPPPAASGAPGVPRLVLHHSTLCLVLTCIFSSCVSCEDTCDRSWGSPGCSRLSSSQGPSSPLVQRRSLHRSLASGPGQIFWGHRSTHHVAYKTLETTQMKTSKHLLFHNSWLSQRAWARPKGPPAPLSQGSLRVHRCRGMDAMTCSSPV